MQMVIMMLMLTSMSRPCRDMYGRPLPALMLYTAGMVRTDTVYALLKDRDTFLADVRDCLLQA